MVPSRSDTCSISGIKKLCTLAICSHLSSTVSPLYVQKKHVLTLIPVDSSLKVKN